MIEISNQKVHLVETGTSYVNGSFLVKRSEKNEKSKEKKKKKSKKDKRNVYIMSVCSCRFGIVETDE